MSTLQKIPAPLNIEVNPEQRSMSIQVNQSSSLNAQASGVLFDLLADKPYPINYSNSDSTLIPLHNIENFRLSLELILKLGDIEHTGDWDPYLHIVQNNDFEFETTPGYTDITIVESRYTKRCTVFFQSYDYDIEEEVSIHVPLLNIKTIQLHR